MDRPREDSRKRKAGMRPEFDRNHVVLSDIEIRELVLQITEREGVEVFVRRMVALMNALRMGQTERVALISKESKDRAFKNLISAIAEAVNEGRVLAAKNTAFYAVSYAYQNSLDYVCGLMGYLDKFNQAPEGDSAAIPSDSIVTNFKNRV